MPTPVPTLDLLRRPQISPRARAVSRALRNPLLLEGTQAPEKISTTNPRCRLLVVIRTAVGRGWCKDTLSRTENQNALPGRAPPKRASEWVLRHQLCLKWARGSGRPGSILPVPTRSYPLPLAIGDPRDNPRAAVVDRNLYSRTPPVNMQFLHQLTFRKQ